jgi:hypothetical protein
VIYKCEVGVLTKKNEIKLEAWEWKRLKKIFKRTKADDGIWRQKNEQEGKMYIHTVT